MAAIDPMIDAGLDPEHRIVLAGGLLGMAEGASVAWMALSAGSSAQSSDKDTRAEADRIAQRVAGLMWAGLRSVHAD